MEYMNTKEFKFYTEKLKLEKLEDLQRDGIYLTANFSDDLTQERVEELFETTDWLDGIIVHFEDVVTYLNEKYQKQPFFELFREKMKELKRKGIVAVSLFEDYSVYKTYGREEYEAFVRSDYEDICELDEHYSQEVSFEEFLKDYSSEDIALIDDLIKADYICL